MKNKFDVNFGIVSGNLQINSTIDFKQVDIEDITNENCLLLDEQNDETFYFIVNAVTDKFKEVVNDNMVSQGLDPIIPVGELEPEQELNQHQEDNNSALSTTDIQTLKEEAKNKIINNVRNAMILAENEGRIYTLQDLMNLNIPDSVFSVSIDGDVATLNIDGFEFKLNSQFQLYE